VQLRLQPGSSARNGLLTLILKLTAGESLDLMHSGIWKLAMSTAARNRQGGLPIHLGVFLIVISRCWPMMCRCRPRSR